MSPVHLSDGIYFDIALRLVASLVIGGLIGLERSYHGRPAGFRTHSLVCLSTSLLMLVTVYETHWFPSLSEGRISLDPTRMAQGIMTGIGFLGAGTIMKDGLSVRGLTTAASIWITAAIGILIGIGFYVPAVIATVLTLGTLSVFRWIESQIPTQLYAQLLVRFRRSEAMSDSEMRRLLTDHGFTVGNLTFRLDADSDSLEDQMIIRSTGEENASRLASALNRLASVKEFRISPTGD
ncbi:MAG TPA: MgtC/SapB family protein [Candidatus Deferrimicrobium sp.]|nr:MgtC/SapB family protein [Candidatus Deferrimicrobium sp.]